MVRQLVLQHKVLFLIITAGILFRASIVFAEPFPLNDGGLFFVMVQSLNEKSFLLPKEIFFNGNSIPFTYSPLGFYLAAIFTKTNLISSLAVFQVLPFIYSSLSCFAFYYFCSQLFRKQTVLCCLFIFSFLIPVVEWQLMGGGITRGLGMLFSIMTMAFYVKFIKKEKNDYRAHFLIAFLLASTILSHPRWGIFTFYSFLFLYLQTNTYNIKRFFYSTLLIGLITCAFLVPWLYFIYIYNNLVSYLPFISAGFSKTKQSILFWSLQPLTQEPFVTFFAALFFLGIFLQLVKGKFHLLIWTTIPFFTMSRGVANVTAIPVSLLAGIGLSFCVFYFQKKLNHRSYQSSINKVACMSIISFMVTYTIVLSAITILTSNVRVSEDEMKGMEWVIKNTSEQAVFLVISNGSFLGSAKDGVNEWFPALTNGRSFAVPQGLEWVPSKFIEEQERHALIVKCLPEGVECLKRMNGFEEIDYVFIANVNKNAQLQSIATQLESQYEVEYSNKSVKVVNISK